MNRKWIVVADRIEARIYREKPFELVERMKNDLGREKNRALMTDKPGWSRSKLAQPSSTHSLTGEKNPHEDAAVQFARQLCRFLEQAGQKRRFDQLTIAAEPKMLGRIRSLLSKNIVRISDWLKKDLGHFSDSEIRRVLGYPSPRVIVARGIE